MKDKVESGRYFDESRKWYNQIFLSPYFMRSAVLTFMLTASIFVVMLYFNIQMLFPINKQIIYTINVQDTANLSAKINNADKFGNNTIKSVAWIFLESYVRIKESYNYEDLGNQMLFVKNKSTRGVYNRYADYLSLDNPDSPVLRLQKYAKQEIVVNKIDFEGDDTAVVEFISESREDNGKLIDEIVWRAIISFAIDPIDTSLPGETPYKFIVSSYKREKIKTLGNNKDNDDQTK